MGRRVPLTAPLRKLALCALLALPLAGCGSDSDYARVGTMLWQDITTIGQPGPPVERSQAAAVPYATLGLRYGSSAEAMLVLATETGADHEWLAGTQLSVITRNGRIIRTVGLPRNLSGFQGPFPGAGSDAAPGSYHYLYDFDDKHMYGNLVICSSRDAGAQTVVIIGTPHRTRHVIESCAAPAFGWEFQNEFWKDAATGYVWKSIQYVHPDGDPITLEILRPEAQ